MSNRRVNFYKGWIFHEHNWHKIDGPKDLFDISRAQGPITHDYMKHKISFYAYDSEYLHNFERKRFFL